MKFTVSRATWFRGSDDGSSKLLREDGKRCCLGHVAQQCGLDDTDMLGRSSPRHLDEEKQGKLPKWLTRPNVDSACYRRNSFACFEAMEANDEPMIPDEERERRLKEIFAAQGDEIEFIP